MQEKSSLVNDAGTGPAQPVAELRCVAEVPKSRMLIDGEYGVISHAIKGPVSFWWLTHAISTLVLSTRKLPPSRRYGYPRAPIQAPESPRSKPKWPKKHGLACRDSRLGYRRTTLSTLQILV